MRSEKGFFRGITYSLLGIVAFLIVFMQFLPPVQTKDSAQSEVSPALAVVAVSEDVKPLLKVSTDTGLNEEQAAYMAKLRAREREEAASRDPKESERQQREWEAEQEREEDEREAELKREQEEYLKKANTVVVTSKGKKYHEPNCRTVKGSSRTLTIAQAKKRGYTPCKVCDPPSSPVTAENIYWGDNVYTTQRVRDVD